MESTKPQESPPPPSTTKMSERICQFFIRGRCKRDNCEFKHEKPEPVVAVKSSAPPAPKDEALSATVNESVKDTSTFIAAASDQPATPVLSRRAAKSKDDDEEALTNGNKDKVIRRDSKGFEVFDDYFSDSADSTLKSPEAKNVEENIQPPVRDAVSCPDQGEPEAQAPVDAVASEDKTSKASLAELSKEWDEGEAQENDQSETIESIENFIQEEGPSEPTGDQAAEEAAGDDNAKDGKKSKEEWVTLIFGEDGKKPEEKKSVYDLNPEGADFEVAQATPFTTAQSKGEETPSKKGKKDALSKTDGLTKIGNNTYFYSGPKTKAEQELQLEDDEEEDGNEETATEGEQAHAEGEIYCEDQDESDASATPNSSKKKRRASRGYDSGRRRHNTNYVYGAKSSAAKTRRCGECEGCNREDCGKCIACIDKHKFGGKGAKKQACIYRMCSWKNPSGKRIAPGSAPVAAPPVVQSPTTRGRRSEAATPASKQTPPAPKATRGGRKSISVISPSSVKVAPDDSELPKFDPEAFRPGYTPPVVKKGNEEYAIIVSGVKDTGLCGKYWSDIDSLPPKRRRTGADQTKPNEQQKVDEFAQDAKRGKQSRKQLLKEKADPSDDAESETDTGTDKPDVKEAGIGRGSGTSRGNCGRNKAGAADAGGGGGGAAKKRKGEVSDTSSIEEEATPAKRSSRKDAKETEEKPSTSGNDEEQADLTRKPSSKSEGGSATEDLTKPVAANVLPSTPTPEDPMANRSVSCVASDSTQREVVVECFAPYDDHRWVNIGKPRDGMTPDAVQYARALRPPYHLLSFLRIKGHSTKGMSCTDKNTMVFVVLEGEITVVLHTTQFSAKKGDSFYIPPKNYYNLINQKAREAELSLIQFQYDGPLPSVAAASQSGMTKAIPGQQQTESQ